MIFGFTCSELHDALKFQNFNTYKVVKTCIALLTRKKEMFEHKIEFQCVHVFFILCQNLTSEMVLNEFKVVM